MVEGETREGKEREGSKWRGCLQEEDNGEGRREEFHRPLPMLISGYA